MAYTYRTDVAFAPAIWTAGLRERMTTLSRIRNSRAVVTDAKYDSAIMDKSFAVSVPFLKPLTNTVQVPVEGSSLSTEKLSGLNLLAPNLNFDKALNWDDLVNKVAPEELMGYVQSQIAPVFVNAEQTAMIAIMNALFTKTTGVLYSTHCNDISAETGDAAVISDEALRDTRYLLGDHNEELAVVFMHSQVKKLLEAQGAITEVESPLVDRNIATPVTYFMYRGALVIEDDSVPYNASTGVADVWMLGNGAFGYGSGVPAGQIPAETDRNILLSGGDTTFVARHWFIMAPEGVSFTGSPAVEGNATPTMTDLAIATNWTKKYENKNIRIVCLRGKVTAEES